MPDTGAPWNIPFLDGTELVRAYPDFSEDLADAVADGLSAAGNAGIGSNVVSTVKTDIFSSNSTSFVDVPDLSVTITPSSSASKVLLIAQISSATITRIGRFRFSGGNSGSFIADSAGARRLGAAQPDSSSMSYLDSPATTSPVTYKVQAAVARSDGSVLVNRNTDDANDDLRARYVSSLTAIEVAA